jgi:hypothetical protein
MTLTLNTPSTDSSPEAIHTPEKRAVPASKTNTLENSIYKHSLEEEVALSIAKAIENSPAPDDLVSSSKHILEAAENISPLEFESGIKRLEELLGELKERFDKHPEDLKAYGEDVFEIVQKLRRSGNDLYLDQFHDGAIEIAKGQEPMVN